MDLATYKFNRSCLFLPKNMNDPITEKIIASAFTVYNQLGFGFLEKIYEKALLIELYKNDLQANPQVPLAVFYDDQIVGEYCMDLVVENQIVVELKSVRTLTSEHEAQLVNYLVATKQDVGLLLNFGPRGVEIRRKYRLYLSKVV